MAGGMKIDWKGVEQLTTTIKDAGTKVREQSGKVVRNNAEKLKSKAQAKAPEDTGFLKTQIKTSYPGELEAHIDDEAATSLAKTGSPLWNLALGLILKVTERPSGARAMSSAIRP